MAQQTYRVEGMDCADCALKIEKGVRRLDGVQAVQIDFSSGMLFVEGSAQREAVQQRVETLGYKVLPLSHASGSAHSADPANFFAYLFGRTDMRLALAGFALLVVSFLGGSLGLSPLPQTILQGLALALAGYPVARGGLTNLWINRDFNIQMLMTIAGLGAFVIGESAESATLIFLFTLSEALEGYTAGRNRRVLREMSEMLPTHAVRLQNGREESVLVDQLRIGDEVMVAAGERIPMDGVISTGQSAVNQAPITGESLPVERAPGDPVYAGTINGPGALIVRLTRLAEDTTIQRIIHLIEQAQQVRAPVQRFIDRFARIYTPLVVMVALFVAIIPPVFFQQPFLNPPDGTGWLYRGLALLVIACPCALVISAPVTILSAITAAARRGVLIKGGAHLEALSGIRLFAFDKTGTLTQGQPAVTAFRSVDCSDGQQCSDCDEVLALASALERRSAHPLARSVVVAAQERGLEGFYPAADDVIAMPGSGVQGRLNGRLATIGSHALFDDQHPHEQILCGWVEEAEQRGETTMLLSDGERVRGFISLADRLRGDSRAAISDLHGLGIQTAILTGDNPKVAQAVASQVGIDHVRAGLLPEDKLSAVQELQKRWGSVAMVGDGINDTPALAAATLGIAVGGASSAQALETADIVLMGADLKLLPFAVRLSAFTRRLIHQNVVFSLATKLIFVLLALGGLTSLWLAVFADMGVSLLVTFNGLRASRFEREAG